MSVFSIIQTVEAAIKTVLVAGKSESGLQHVYTSTGMSIMGWVAKIQKVTPCVSIEADLGASTPGKLVENVLLYTEQSKHDDPTISTLIVADAVCDQLLADMTLGGVLAVPFEFAGFEIHSIDGKLRDETVITLEIAAGENAFIEGGVVQPEKRTYIRDYETGASDYTALEGWTQLEGLRPENGYKDDIVEGRSAGMAHGADGLYTPSRSPILTRSYLLMTSLGNLGYVLKRPVVDGKINHWREYVTPANTYALLFKWRINKTTDLVRFWPKVVGGQVECEITETGGAPCAFQAIKDDTAGDYPMGYSTTETI